MRAAAGALGGRGKQIRFTEEHRPTIGAPNITIQRETIQISKLCGGGAHATLPRLGPNGPMLNAVHAVVFRPRPVAFREIDAERCFS